MRIILPIKVIKQKIDKFATEQPLIKELLGRSFPSQSLQKQYWMAFDYRRKMLNFKHKYDSSLFTLIPQINLA